MLLLTLKGVRMAFGAQDVLDIDHWEVYEGERIGLVGENGAGKTTLLDIIAGEKTPDEGHALPKCDVAYIRQIEGGEGDAADPRLLKELGVSGLNPTEAGLSGGERTRLRIAAALETDAPLLLCDEPTCNLDLGGIEWLQRALERREGAMIIVSHDRRLLDSLCTSIVLIEDGKPRSFPGGYSDFLKQREREREFRQFEYESYKKEKARLAKSVQETERRSSKVKKTPTRMGNSEARLHRRSATEIQEKLNRTAKSIESRLAQLEHKERPRDDPEIRMAMPQPPPIVSRTALRIEGFSAAFGGRSILSDAAFELPARTRTVMMGPNGAGKTTLLRAVTDGDPCVKVSPGIRMCAFTQNLDTLDASLSVLDNLKRDSNQNEGQLRTILARLGIRGDAVHKRVGVLSGGERAKVQLARMFAAEANLLLLDEPTNYLDLYAMEALETLLRAYEGTALIITHDRQLADVADRLLWVEDGGVRTFGGNYSQYSASLTPTHVAPDHTLIEMRLAELGARFALDLSEEEREKLGEEYDALVRALSEG